MYIVKSRMNGKYCLQTLKTDPGDASKAFVEDRNKTCGLNYTWKHYSREYKTVRVELHELD